jgi:MYXO-CTERM domain-containing protein
MSRHTTVSVLALSIASLASAHIGYSGRDFGTITDTVKTISNQTVSSSFGWADATDADWGDSHRGRFFRFRLEATTTIQITAQRNSLGSGTQGTFLPAFSLFAGLGQLSPENAGHDSAELSIASRPAGTEGSTRALADWSIGNDAKLDSSGNVSIAARLAYFTYIGHAADGTSANYGLAAGILGDGVADGFVTGTFVNLAAGDYSIWVAGANYTAQTVEGPSPFPTYGVTVSVGAVPAPGAVALLGVAGFLGRRRRA